MNNTAEDIIKEAMKKGCDASEVFMKRSKGISAEAKNGRVEALEVSLDLGIAIKVIKNKKIGFAFATSDESIEKTVNEAVQSAEWTGVDEYFDVPESLPFQDVSVYDKQIHDLSEDEVISDAIVLEESAMSVDSRIKKVRKAGSGAGTGSTTIVNSKGVNVTYESTYYSAYVTALAQDNNGDSQMGWDFAGSRKRSDVEIRRTGETAGKRAVELLGSRKISAVKAPVILSPSVAVEFLDILSSSLSAEAVQKQRSFLADKIDKDIISDSIEIIDDGTMPWGTGTRPVDDEGVPAANKTLVSDGILRGYIHNTYTANKAGVTSTGNAVRGSAKSLPGIGVTNCYIRAANGNARDNLPGIMARGILILGAMGVHTANPVSGDFSVGISGLWIENGEVAYPIKEAVISGNILDVFKKIECTGNDLTFYGNTGSPSLLIGDMDISA